jgi:putative DNA primase/helicase
MKLSDFEHLTDLGNAKRLVKKHGDKLRYVKQWGWVIYDGKRWRLDEFGAAERCAKDIPGTIYTETGLLELKEDRELAGAWAAKSESAARIEAMLRLAQSEKEVRATPDFFDTNPMLFNCLSGTLDLATGELKPHNPANMITKLAKVEYKPDAQCPAWLDFLCTIMGKNEALVTFLQRAIGYSLTGLTTEQAMFLLYGTGRNGKTTMLEVLAAMLGDYSQQSSFSTFLEKQGDGPRNDIAKLVGSRLVSAVEADPGRRLAESVIKTLTGGDTVPARFLFKEEFSFKPAFKIWLAANHKPVIRGQDLGIWRRIKLVPFEVTIPEKEVDKHLPDKLRAELPGILAWAVKGCLAWQKDGLEEPKEVTEATTAYKGESDILIDFMAECCIKGKNRETDLSTVYRVYTCWCDEEGERPLGKRNFTDALNQRNILVKAGHSNRRIAYGVTIHQEWINRASNRKSEHRDGKEWGEN